MTIPGCSVPWLELPGVPGALYCPGVLQPVDYQQLALFDLSQLDPVTLAAAFGAGFTTLGVITLLGFSFAAIINFISRI